MFLDNVIDNVDNSQPLDDTLPSPLPFHSSGCQFVAQPAYFMVEWSETKLVLNVTKTLFIHVIPKSRRET